MPLPHPSEDEKQDDFISRFMSNEAMQKEYPTQAQRLAMAYGIFRQKNNMRITTPSRIPMPVPTFTTGPIGRDTAGNPGYKNDDGKGLSKSGSP